MFWGVSITVWKYNLYLSPLLKLFMSYNSGCSVWISWEFFRCEVKSTTISGSFTSSFPVRILFIIIFSCPTALNWIFSIMLNKSSDILVLLLTLGGKAWVSPWTVMLVVSWVYQFYWYSKSHLSHWLSLLFWFSTSLIFAPIFSIFSILLALGLICSSFPRFSRLNIKLLFWDFSSCSI